MEIRRILCAVDFSEPSRAALHAAADVAARFDAPLTLVHVNEVAAYIAPYGAFIPPIDLGAARAGAAEELERWRLEAKRLGAPETNLVVTDGSAWRGIVESARAYGSDLIVIGTHGHSGLKHVVLGSVAERVVQHAGCPVLTIRPRESRGSGTAASDP